ncbi:MAG: adenylate/guanylate cyclase domain-containing protein, partial [Candidatus Pelagibacter sp. TMED203]
MKILSNWMMGFVTLAVITFIGLQDPFVKETLRLKSFDLLAQYEEQELSPDIGIVTIDEASIEKYGQYPWNREVLADIIYRLRHAEVGIIVMPILFSEPDRLGGDEMFMISLHQMGVVIAQVGTNQTHKNAAPRGVAKIGDPLPWLYEWNGMLGPIPELGGAADGVGVINTAPEIDGVVRRLPLIMRVGEETYPAMAIETIRVATGNPSYQIKAGDGGVIAVRVPGYPTINTDAHARIWLRWNNTFQSVSAAAKDYSQLKGKTVVVGITAEGLGSIIATPVGEQYDWALSASALQTVINGTAPKRYDISLIIELMISVLVGLIIVVLTRFTPYWAVGGMMILFYSGSAFGTYWLFSRHLILADASWIIIVTTVVGMHSIFNRFILEFKEKQKIKKQFAGYCSPTVVRMLQENPQLIKDGMKREISICFSDL